MSTFYTKLYFNDVEYSWTFPQEILNWQSNNFYPNRLVTNFWDQGNWVTNAAPFKYENWSHQGTVSKSLDCGDGWNYSLGFTYGVGGNGECKIYKDVYNSTIDIGSSADSAAITRINVCFEKNGTQARIGYLYTPGTDGRWTYYKYGNWSSELYTFLEAHLTPVIHNWKAVPSLTGKLGTFNFSMIGEEYINNGEFVGNAPESNLERLLEPIQSYISNMPLITETPILYAGKVYYMTITQQSIGGIIATQLKFYMHEGATPFWTETILDPTKEYLSFIIDEENEIAKVSIIKKGTGDFSYNSGTYTATDKNNMWIFLRNHIATEDEESIDNFDNTDNGGDNWNPYHNYPISDTSIPSKSAINTGFTSMFEVTQQELKDLSDFLWSDTFVDNVKKFFNDPREIIVGLMIMPVIPDKEGTNTEIQAGGISTGINGRKLTSQYKEIDFGYVDIHEVSKTFLDYPPNTKISVYLPYCGEHSLDVNAVQNEKLHLKYVFDMLSGAVIAKMEAGTKGWIYCYGGQAGVQIPTSAEDFTRQYSSILSAGATIGSTIATIATGGLTAPLAIGSAASMLSNGMNLAPDVQYNSGGGGTAGFLAQQQPYIRLEIPKPLVAGDKEAQSSQYEFLGKTTYQNLKLSSCSGFTKVIKAHLENIPCTAAEKAEIEKALQTGVIIQSGSPKPTVTPTTTGNIVICFMNMKSENEVIGKLWDTGTNESLIYKIEGTLIYDQDIMHPIILIEGDARNYNYSYIDIFKRYYYIDKIVIRSADIQEIHLSADPLQSFKGESSTSYVNGILDCRAIVERQKKKGNTYMTDPYIWTRADKDIITQPFTGGNASYRNTKGEQYFDRTNNTYILTIAGG